MRDPLKMKYIRWGLTLFAVVASSIVLAMLLSHLSVFGNWISGIYGAFTPLVWGLVLAYILNPVATRVHNRLYRLFSRKHKPESAEKAALVLSVVVAIFLAVLTIFGIIMLIIPQLISSVQTLINNGSDYYEKAETWVNHMLEDRPNLQQYAENVLDNSYAYLEDWLENKLLPSAQSVVTAVATGVYSVVRWIVHFFIGMIVAAYMLANKKKLLAQCRTLNAAIWSTKVSSRILEIVALSNRAFGGFIRGKLLDSAIIGVLCYLGAVILKLPYAILVAAIVGITNVIPFFGPLIGAIPCAFLILLVSPIKCLYFIIFILLLQQLDGHIIGPRILGDSIGLSSFWILVSIIVFSGLFGFAGMLLGVPLFAVFYSIIKEVSENILLKKGLPVDTAAYYEPKALAPTEPKDEEQPVP